MCAAALQEFTFERGSECIVSLMQRWQKHHASSNVERFRDHTGISKFLGMYTRVVGISAMAAMAKERPRLCQIVPLKMPKQGGNLWLELKTGDTVTGSVPQVKQLQGKAVAGQVAPLQVGKPCMFDPKRLRATEHWKHGENHLSSLHHRQLLEGQPSCDRRAPITRL